MSSSTTPLSGRAIIEAFKLAQIQTVAALPDIVTCENLLWPIASDRDLRLVSVCKEDEGVSICAALSYTNHRAILLIQHTGFLDSINAIRVIAVEYQLPVVMVVGLQGMESHLKMTQSSHIGIRSLPGILNALELDYDVLEHEHHVSILTSRIEECYLNMKPWVFFLPHSPA